MSKIIDKKQRKWYERYLPFIAQSPQLQVDWLVNACREKVLSTAELTPYIRLLLSPENIENNDNLQILLNSLDKESMYSFLDIVEIYDLPRLILVLPKIDREFASHALRKDIPAYEKNIQKIVDNVFAAINSRSEDIFKDIIMGADKVDMAPHFRQNLERFQKILDDEVFLRSLYPHAN